MCLMILLMMVLMGCSGDDEEFDKALYNFYVNNKVKYLKRKLSSAGRRNVVSLFSLPWVICMVPTL